jgi:hypothetical protein
MSDTHAMAQLRSDLLTALHEATPSPLNRDQLMELCRTSFLTRDKTWFADAVVEQLKVLNHASLIRPFHGGYILTDRGKRDREQAARFINNKQPKGAA